MVEIESLLYVYIFGGPTKTLVHPAKSSSTVVRLSEIVRISEIQLQNLWVWQLHVAFL